MVNFDVTAVGRLIEYSTRLSENRNKLSSNFEKISEILIESHAFARLEELDIVLEKHVIKAINEKEKRFSNYEIKLHELIRKNILMLQTRGFSIGQVNALSVISMDDYSFAIPSKITATCFVGKAGVIDIDKECDMSGSIHNKGVQVIDGYIGQTYAQKFPLSLSCKLCFEQNYEGIDGDSASSSETYAILSALSGYPINNEIAVTGSMNQKGDIQPVGGVTYKIEGFYNICKTQGLTGTQGVIIPVQNRDELVLKDEVVEAVKQGMFHIYPISHIDEGVEILMGVKAGTLLEDGTFTVNSVHNKVASKLKYFYDCSNL
jgi:predicted ATP-dependent protease